MCISAFLYCFLFAFRLEATHPSVCLTWDSQPLADQRSNILVHVSSLDEYLLVQCHTQKSAPVSMIDDHDIGLRLIQNRTAELDQGSW